MKIRSKILVYFSVTVILIAACSLALIYFLFSEHREEEFQQRQKEKMNLTIGLLNEYREMSESLTHLMDQFTINDFYDEKMLVYDQNKRLVYASVDDLSIAGNLQLLNQLSAANRWVETKEGKYDVVGIYAENGQKSFYAVSKAYDAFGFSKLHFLRNTLLTIFLVLVIAVLLVSIYLSKRISKPIADLAHRLGRFKPGEEKPDAGMETTTYEIRYLNEKFTELMLRTNEAFLFQKHTIQHISHELKTPIAVLVSELEKLKERPALEAVRQEMDNQINRAKSLGSMINVLLQISKIESGQTIATQSIRLDELLFDLVSELGTPYPGFNFDVQYIPEEFDLRRLTIKGNEMLVRQAFLNLLSNSIAYADNGKAQIVIDCSSDTDLKITITNQGPSVDKDEEPFLFDRFFRGRNSKGKIGFGLGLILTKKIIDYYAGTISYASPAEGQNVFFVSFPLS